MKKQFPKRTMERARYRSAWRWRWFTVEWWAQRDGFDWARECASSWGADTASGRFRLASPILGMDFAGRIDDLRITA